ncbi:MAG: ABC transporter ATP-binding protein [Sarcina sp.]
MLKIKGLTKKFDNRNVLEDIDLEIKQGDFIAVVGPSGCGKSTLLNIVAGIEKEFEGEYKNDFKKVCVMFQEGGLFPWLTVYENVEFGIKNIITSDAKRRVIVEKYLKMVHLTGFKDFQIKDLSGGMKQRVALARALAYESDMLILDEPFSALDSQTRDILLVQVQKIWMETGKTFLFVTHSVEEGIMLANEIILLSVNPGKVKKRYKIDLSRPRTLSNKEITDYVIKIQEDLKEEVLKVASKEYDKDYNIEEDDILYNPSDDMEYFL